MQWCMHSDHKSVRIDVTILQYFLESLGSISIAMARLLAEADRIWEVVKNLNDPVISLLTWDGWVIECKRIIFTIDLLELIQRVKGDGGRIRVPFNEHGRIFIISLHAAHNVCIVPLINCTDKCNLVNVGHRAKSDPLGLFWILVCR